MYLDWIDKTYLNDCQAHAIKSEHKLLVIRDVFTYFLGKAVSTIVKEICQRDTGQVVIFQEALWLPAGFEKRPLPISVLYHHGMEASVRWRTGRISTGIK